jgi:hypothetical protein
MKAMEVDGHKGIMLKTFANVSESMVIKKREVNTIFLFKYFF